MRRTIVRLSLFATFAVTIAACSRANGPVLPASPGIAGQALHVFSAATSSTPSIACACYRVIYDFGTQPNDGGTPSSGLYDLNGTFYGVTGSGGTSGFGTAYSVTPSGMESVIHSFYGANDGIGPAGDLVAVNGMLYGTTDLGGANHRGMVFGVTPAGTEKQLYAFATISGDGYYPSTGLRVLNGALFGVTNGGGAYGPAYGYGYGTVFRLTTSGAEKPIYSFGGVSGDGQYPSARLTFFNGSFYGTTSNGGAYGYGTVFSITPKGDETVLHSFSRGADGSFPAGGLVVLNGVLYGTTIAGGTSDQGTVYSITPAGTETVLHSFANTGGDGEQPAGLKALNGVLYGTTEYGGADGKGAIFAITASGTESVLFSFAGWNGKWPTSDLTAREGVLYGTASAGGKYKAGVVFRFKP
jgi:uncharacterized repeat protein (TIGR03803 family)